MSIYIDPSNIPTLEFDEIDSNSILENEFNRKSITVYILSNDIEIKRGQIINTINDEARYRNDGKLIWDGRVARWLSTAYDEYGSISREFQVSPTEFDPDSWIDTICHNTIYWPCILYRIQVRDSLVFDDELTEEKYWHGYFTHKGEIHHVFLNDYYDEDAIYDPKLNEGITMCINGIIYTSDSRSKRSPIEVFKKAVMRSSIPFNYNAGNFIDMKDNNIKSSYMEILY